MGIMEYDIIYVLTFLGSGLTALGITVFGIQKNQILTDNVVDDIPDDGNPPEDEEELPPG
jgi:hypothetical protein